MRYLPLYIALLVAAGAGFFAWLFNASPDFLTILGGGFQLGGVFVVVVTLANARHPFNVDSWGRQFRRFARRFVPRFLRRKRESRGSLRAELSAFHMAAPGSVDVELSPDATLEQRIARLESVTARIEDAQQALQKRFMERIQSSQKNLDAEREARIANDAELEKRIQAVAIGDEAWHLAGATLFAAGIIFQTWPALASLAT